MVAASILIPTHNRAHYLGDAVASALRQTWRDLEVVVVDDGSTDQTPALLAGIADPRLRVVRHATNRGIPAARNTALDEARGHYVAWLDSDDVARPTRLAEQIAFLERRPDIAMVGACAGKLRLDGTPRRGVRVPPLNPEAIAAWLLFRSAFQQSSVTGRASVLRAHRFRPDFPVCEDLEMFVRLQQAGHRLANLPRTLVDRRVHPGQTVRCCQGSIRERKMALYAPMLERLGVTASEDDLRRHVLLGKARLEDAVVDRDFLAWARNWLNRIASANERSGMLDRRSLALASGYVWVLACRAAVPALGEMTCMRALGGSPWPLALMSGHAVRWAGRAVPAFALGR